MPRLADPTSCYTCRKRKLKCDGKLPTCARCEKSKLICDRASRLSVKLVAPGGIESLDDSPRSLLKQPHIADLFHIYIKELAPWYDLNDVNCTFTREVAARALNSSLLFASIIAFAACFSARRSSSSLAIAEAYHDKCVRFLIGLAAEDEVVQNGIALAATCLLRSFELLSEVTDPNRHLFGGFSLLPPQIPSLEDTSLLATGFWNWLREELTYCLINECPLKMDKRFTVGIVNPDNIANAVTLLLARTVNIEFNGRDDPLAMQTLQLDIESCWQPYQPHPFTYHWSGQDEFPTIKCLRDTDAAALHYYRVMQCITGCDDRETIAAEICGLAMSSMSNAVVVNSFGPIAFTGGWLERASQRNALVRWLNESQKRTTWPVGAIIQKLYRAWGTADILP